MIKLLYTLFVLLNILFLPNLVLGQIKQEKEFRISKTAFPKAALELLEEDLLTAKKIRYYQEINGKETSYEAKFKQEGSWYSAEFSDSGVLEDIEVRIAASKIPDTVHSSIQRYIKEQFKSGRIIKIQEQFVNTDSIHTLKVLKAAFKKENSTSPVIPRYEVLAAARKKKESYKDYELLFDHRGCLLKITESLPPAYGYILY